MLDANDDKRNFTAGYNKFELRERDILNRLECCTNLCARNNESSSTSCRLLVVKSHVDVKIEILCNEQEVEV